MVSSAGMDREETIMLLARGRSLQEHAELIRAARLGGEDTCQSVVAMFQGVAAALAKEFLSGHLLFRLLPEDVMYDPQLQAYAVAADVPRYPLQGPPPSLTLLDNGIFAPEITGHNSRPVSARTMVHNLGALLFHAACGLVPTPGFLRLAAGDLPPISAFVPDLPLGLDPLLRHALRINPDDRLPDPAAFAARLGELLAHDSDRRGRRPDDELALHFSASTHPGIQKSEKNPVNQDHHLCRFSPEQRLGLFVVADGVSTCHYGSGERAAFLTVQAAEAGFGDMLADPALHGPPSRRDARALREHLKRMLERANARVIAEMAAAHPGRLGPGAKIMSSTATLLLVNGSQAIIGNLGDSRAYLVRGEWIDQLTVDLDKRTWLLRQGKGLESIMNGSGLGELVANVGCFSIDSRGQLVPAGLEPEFLTLNLLPGDRLLVCSDGVPDCIGPDAESRMREIIGGAKRPAQAAWELLVAANKNGGLDNLTAVVIDCLTKEPSK